MSQEERFNLRDRSYSAWHRRLSMQRFVGIEKAQTLAMIDLDASLYVEYDDASKEPIALIEAAMDRGQNYKSATVTMKLAARCRPILPAYCVLYTIGNSPNPADKRWADISEFRVRQIWPEPPPEWRVWRAMSPERYAIFLSRLRERSATFIDEMLHQQHASNAA